MFASTNGNLTNVLSWNTGALLGGFQNSFVDLALFPGRGVGFPAPSAQIHLAGVDNYFWDDSYTGTFGASPTLWLTPPSGFAGDQFTYLVNNIYAPITATYTTGTTTTLINGSGGQNATLWSGHSETFPYQTMAAFDSPAGTYSGCLAVAARRRRGDSVRQCQRLPFPLRDPTSGAQRSDDFVGLENVRLDDSRERGNRFPSNNNLWCSGPSIHMGASVVSRVVYYDHSVRRYKYLYLWRDARSCKSASGRVGILHRQQHLYPRGASPYAFAKAVPGLGCATALYMNMSMDSSVGSTMDAPSAAATDTGARRGYRAQICTT